MKLLILTHILCVGFSLGICVADDKISTTTKNKFSDEQKKEMMSLLKFSKIGETIHLRGLLRGQLPLELSEKKSFDTSDGVLSLGDSFMWPGCGFDRTFFTVWKITDEFVVISYSKGSLQRDGYHDSGQFKIQYSTKTKNG